MKFYEFPPGCSPFVGSVNAGFGTTWSEAAAQARGYRRAEALEELRQALRGEAMPVTDHGETLGGSW